MKRLFTYSSVLLCLVAFLLFVTPNFGDSLITSYYQKGNHYYKNGDFESALREFHRAIDQKEVFTQKYPWIQFKIGYCNYKTKRYQEAIDVFNQNYTKLKSIEDYTTFFSLMAVLERGDTLFSLNGLNSFPTKFPNSSLIPIVYSELSEIYFKQQNWKRAEIFYNRQLSYSYFDKGDIYAQLIKIYGRTKQISDLKKHAFTMLKKYPFHPQSEFAYKELIRVLGSTISANDFKALYKYLVRTTQFKKAERLVRFQERSVGKSELTNWLGLELLYKKGQYQNSLNESLSKRSSFTNKKYLREVDLNIARCYLRLGDINNSIKAYVQFQQRYPKDYLSPEVFWKIAWIYSEENNELMAHKYYEKLISTYPRSKFVTEARFRIGLSFYSKNQFELARNSWKKSFKTLLNDYEKSRFKYWIAKTYMKEKNFRNYLNLLSELSETPFDSYYNLKAFLLTGDNAKTHQFVDSLLWEMHHDQVSYLGENIDKLEHTLLVQDILGDLFAGYELNNNLKKLKTSNWQFRYSLAELQEKLKNYGRSYRLYRNVFDNHFINKEWNEWIFLFKKLYPLYYNNNVNYYAKNRSLTPALVLAIIKKESAFMAEIVSVADAYGLMQIIPQTAKQIASELNLEYDDIRMLYDADLNINFGTYYISELLKRYNWNVYHALAAYNAGPHRVDRWRKKDDLSDHDFFMENIEFSETRKYVRTVMKYYWTYYLIIHPQDIPDNEFSFPQRLVHQSWYNEIRKN